MAGAIWKEETKAYIDKIGLEVGFRVGPEMS
jgi:hypothetical protein